MWLCTHIHIPRVWVGVGEGRGCSRLGCREFARKDTPGALASITVSAVVGGTLRLFARCGAVLGLNAAAVAEPAGLSFGNRHGGQKKGGTRLICFVFPRTEAVNTKLLLEDRCFAQTTIRGHPSVSTLATFVWGLTAIFVAGGSPEGGGGASVSASSGLSAGGAGTVAFEAGDMVEAGVVAPLNFACWSFSGKRRQRARLSGFARARSLTENPGGLKYNLRVGLANLLAAGGAHPWPRSSSGTTPGSCCPAVSTTTPKRHASGAPEAVAAAAPGQGPRYTGLAVATTIE